ncbi:MAG: tyrosine-type recombinase/integrase, partial [Acidobacteriota bacterium]
TGLPRYVPLGEYAIQWLRSLVVYPDNPWVFVLATGRALKEPRESLASARKVAGLSWVRGFHDLRHFRATQWLVRGVDIQTVKCYLGHKRIETTQRYLHLVPGHAEQSVRKAQAAEQQELEQIAHRSGRQMGDTQVFDLNEWDSRTALSG